MCRSNHTGKKCPACNTPLYYPTIEAGGAHISTREEPYCPSCGWPTPLRIRPLSDYEKS